MRRAAAAVALATALAGAAPASASELAYWGGNSAGAPEVWIARADGSGARALGVGESALLSPSGAMVASIPWGFAGPGVTLYSRTGAIRGRFFDASEMTVFPQAWSADSRYLAVSITDDRSGPRSRSGLYVIDTRAHRTARLARGGIAGVSFAPAGSDRLVYGRSASLNFRPPTNLFLATPDGRTTRQLTHDYFSADPAWGVRGIAYNHAPGAHPATAINQVFLIQPDGRGATQVTDFRQRRFLDGVTPLHFSANGRRLLGELDVSGTAQTWVIDVPTHRAQRLTVGGHNVTPAGLSHDGRTVLVAAVTGAGNNDLIETINLRTAEAHVIARGDGPTWNR